MLYGVDVHDGFQAGISFPLLRQQGYSFAVVKLTEGSTYARDLGDDWVRAARSAGLIPGGYHFLRAGDGAGQARWFHQHVVAAGGPDGMLIQLDAESDGYGQEMAAWAAEWDRLTGGHPWLLYSGGWWWPKTGGFNGALLTPYLWDSHYLTADADTIPDDPAAFAARIPAAWWTPGYGGWPRATMLQFTSRGDAGGLGNNVDLDVTTLTREQLLALTKGGPMTTLDDGDKDVIRAALFDWDTFDPPTGDATEANPKWYLGSLLTVGFTYAKRAAVAAEQAATKVAALADPRTALVAALKDPTVVAALAAALPDGVDEATVEHALRTVLGSLAPAS